MMASDNQDRKFMDNLLHFILDQREKPEEVADDLKAMGIDAQPLRDRVRKLVEQKREEGRLAWIHEADRERLEFQKRAEQRASSLDEMTREQMVEYIERLQRGDRELAVQFRNFEKMTDEDLRSTIEDLELLEGEDASEGDE